RPAGVLQAPPLAHDALPSVERRCELEDAEGRLVERGVDPLPLAGRVAVPERGHDPERGEQAGPLVRIHGRGARWGSIGGTRELPGAPERRADRCVSRSLIQGPGLAERRDARHNQPRIDRVKRIPPEAPALENPGPEVLENDVAPGHEPA